ncbi:PB1 domain containing protein [Acanthamoeba castellanii str. Neff]|uniref:PB1 domain containing protein n=1 Tax=Acanthamoeba castellanii (strain ATCC 30010 / Neff) TaxID=1257118 RepID=L8GRV3_ACACF|nr:PB1 domain containing protein [Acanthamoeba castellanii str. Neff]ELR15632.1 PB1 domain containing protein [Acanthamoeba castellanii str. Neff]
MQSSTTTTTDLPIYVKVTQASDTRTVVTASASFAELERQVRKSFGLSERHQLDLRYIDDEQDRVCVSSDEELRYALNSFQDKSLHLFLATKNAEESANCADKKAYADDDDTAKHEEAAQELKKRLDQEGFDVPEKRCRKLVAKWNGNVDLAEEAARLWRQRKAARATDELLPQGFFPSHHSPHRHFGGHHGPHRHYFGPHHGPHRPHHQPHQSHHRRHHIDDAECEPKPGPHHLVGHHYRHGPHHEVHQLHSHHPHHQPHPRHHRHHHIDDAACEPQHCGHHDHKWKKHHHPEHRSRQIEALLLHRMAKRECAHQALRCPKAHHGLGAGRHHHAHGPRRCRDLSHGHGHGPHHPRQSFCATPPMPGFAFPRVPRARFHHHCFA